MWVVIVSSPPPRQQPVRPCDFFFRTFSSLNKTRQQISFSFSFFFCVLSNGFLLSVKDTPSAALRSIVYEFFVLQGSVYRTTFGFFLFSLLSSFVFF